ncbi:MAG TPA: flavodoxin family protein, partial [Methanomicrobiales archaeon]|nr:flavodoxin family protein [Methanomicrobiales archaeon]
APIASWVGENDEDTTKDWDQIERNKYTQEDLQNMIDSTLRLAYNLKRGAGKGEEPSGTP